MSDVDVEINPHVDLSVKVCHFGNENAPLIVIDNFVANPESLVEVATHLKFSPAGRFFPGVRAAAPSSYQSFLLRQLPQILKGVFCSDEHQLKLLMCHFSLITTPASHLGMLQRIPHFDSLESHGLATVHYLFKKNLGGTAFYRHRKTSYESIDESRGETYFRSLESENNGPNMPGPEYICGDTALYEQIMSADAVFNRMIVYRRNSLHSGSLAKDFYPDADPLTGRLSINSFIDVF